MSVHAEPAPIALSDGSVPAQPLTVVDVPGAGRAAGRAYGEACRELIRYHLDCVLERLSAQRGLGADAAYGRALPYRDATAAEQPELADDSGATDLETTTTSTARIEPRDGLLAHSNHYVAASLAEREETTEKSLRNSERRLRRMETLLGDSRGRHDVASMAGILRDRDGVPDALCRASGEWDDDVITIASTIAEVRARRLWVTVGPPHLAAYRPYAVAGSA